MNSRRADFGAWSAALSPRIYFWGLALFAAIVLFAGLGFRELWSGDETRVAGIGAGMFLNHNYLVPRLLGLPFVEYPPLFYWLEAGAFAIFGVNDFAAKLPSALAAFAAVLLLFQLARNFGFPARVGLFAGVMLCTGAQFFEQSRLCMVDMVLACCVLLAWTGYVGWRRSTPGRWIRLGPAAMLIAGVALGLLTKGPAALALIGAGIGADLLLEALVRRRLAWRHYATLAAAVLIGLIPMLLWGWLLYRVEGPEEFHEVFVVNTLGRFLGSQGDHNAPWYDYFTMLPGVFWPWLPLVPFALYGAFRKARSDDRFRTLLCLLLAPFLLLCLASAKRQVYLLPLYAPLALLGAAWLEGIVFGADHPRVAVLLRHLTPRRALAGLTLLAAVYIGVDAVCYTRNDRHSVRDLFLDAERLAHRQGGRVWVFSPAERLMGAAMFYLQPDPEFLLHPEKFGPNDVAVLRWRHGEPEAPGITVREYPDHTLLLFGNRESCVTVLNNFKVGW